MHVYAHAHGQAVADACTCALHMRVVHGCDVTTYDVTQAFVLERQIGSDAARLCAACLGTVQAVSY